VLFFPRLCRIVHSKTLEPLSVRRVADVLDELLREGEGADVVESLDDEGLERMRDETDDSGGDLGG
jgi:hypothetical protein